MGCNMLLKWATPTYTRGFSPTAGYIGGKRHDEGYTAVPRGLQERAYGVNGEADGSSPTG